MSELVENDDDFASAFAELSKLDDAPAAKPVEEVPSAPVVDSADSTSDTPVADAAPPEESAESAPASPKEEVPAPVKLADEDLLERFAQIVKKTPAEPAPAPQVAHQVPEPDIYSPAEQAVLAEYEKEWPDVAKAEALRRRGEYRQMVGYIFAEVAKEIAPVLARYAR